MECDGRNLLLRLNGIGKTFAGNRVLKDVSFDLAAGEVHILAGENGAGKSTLIKILAGIHTEYEGRIEIRGSVAKFGSPLDAARQGISVIHQELSLIDSMSVAENIFLGREKTVGLTGRQWLRPAVLRLEAAELCRSVGLNIDVSEKVESFPLAVKNGIEIAKALVSSESRILVMDEPTSALNAPEVERLFELIANLKTLGYGIIYISHKMEEIYQLADRITVLRDGAVVGTAKAKDLPKQELIRWMIGREMNDQFPRRGVPLPTESPERICVTGFSAPGVREVSFHVRAGEVLGLAGLQGSGNSELLNAVFGTYGRKVSGEVRLGGKRTPVRSPSHSIRSGLALLTNDRKATGLVLGMGIRENITLASMRAVSRGGWVSRKKERTRAEAMKRKLSIRATSIEQEAGALSGGNQQKVALAKWLETGPQVLFLDEPTRGVDVGAKHEIYELIHGLTEQGMAVVLITSEMPELLSLSDRIMVLHRGRVTAEFARGEATQENVLEAAMGFPETAASREAL